MIDSPAANSDQTPTATASCNERFLGSDLAENSAQLVEVDRLAEMKIEAGFSASPDIFVVVKSSKGHAFHGLFSFGLRDHVVAGPSGKPMSHKTTSNSFDWTISSALCMQLATEIS